MELLKAYGTLRRHLRKLGQISKNGLLQKLTEHREQAFMSQRLVALKDDCPIEVTRDTLAYRGRDVEKLRALYTELGFTRMLGLLNTDSSPPRARDLRHRIRAACARRDDSNRPPH